MKKDAKQAYDELEASSMDNYDYLGKSASSHDQTGLIPSAPQNAAELESYQGLYPYVYPPPVLNDDLNKTKG